MRHGARELINQQPDLEVCGEAATGEVAFELVQRLHPDLLVAGLSLRAGGRGLELIKNLKEVLPGLVILVISMHDERFYAERALRAGAMGYVMKHETTEKLLEAMRQVLGGQLFLADAVKDRMVHRLVAAKPMASSFPIDTLSMREMEVFRLLGDGLSTRQIAERLELSVKTIDSYREHLKLKLRLADGTALVQHAIQWMRSETAS